jgi:hypothetical protein
MTINIEHGLDTELQMQISLLIQDQEEMMLESHTNVKQTLR